MNEAARLVGADSISVDFPGDEEDSEDVEEHRPTLIRSVLDQLRVEPRNNRERAAKFLIYEVYSHEVESMRTTIVNLNTECEDSVPAAVSAMLDIRALESTDAMAIPDNTQEWFVFHMMQMAQRNNVKMAARVDDFEKKLKFLSENDQQECPSCLEPFGPTKFPKTLGCCHKICTECWARWTTVMHELQRHPFCPLCRYREFLIVVKTEKEGGADASGSDVDKPGTSGTACSALVFGSRFGYGPSCSK
jgi:hypothetical protein